MVEPDIDLYADDLDAEFGEDDYNHESADLYDDVITPSEGHNSESKSSDGRSSPHHHHHHSSNGRRIAIYVGNLTWWTTDEDLSKAIRNVGVPDLIDVKFMENRANGQSKGYCMVTLGSENSLRLITDKLPSKELHGQNPVVAPFTRQNLTFFEQQSRKNSGGSRPDNEYDKRGRDMDRREGGMRSSYRNDLRSSSQDRMRPSAPPHQNYQAPMPRGHPYGHQAQHPTRPPVQYQQQQPGAPPWMAGPPPQIHHLPPPPVRPPALPPSGPPPSNNIPPPPGLQGPPPLRPVGPPANLRMPPPIHAVPPPQAISAPRSVAPLPDLRGPPPTHPDWERHPPPQHVSQQPQQPPPPARQPIPSQGMPPGLPPPSHSNINAALSNPPFLQQRQPIPQPVAPPTADAYNRAPPNPQFSEYRPSEEKRKETLSQNDPEFDEIMSRNRSVSSSAISRAVADASAGEFASAIETLVTAISLIKQSKVSGDERCKILISSLQDTLHGIESKSYGSRSKERARSRERERSRERSSRKPSRRERSRSREREYRERSRERDRYHEDRYREKDRDHDRDRRGRH